MGRIEKTVFISYRRTNFPWALAIYKDLHNDGYDVFFDYLSINSGDFEKVILENIKARAHFLVILTPSALERCKEPDDWFRREIETAMDENRNIIPLFVENFDFGSPTTVKTLTGKLLDLKKYSGLGVPAEYFDAAMTKLRERFLNIPLESVLHPVSELAQQETKKQKAAANQAPAVENIELTAQEWYERGYVFANNNRFDEAIRSYTEVIRLQPNYAQAYSDRANVRRKIGDPKGAIADCNEALRLQPNLVDAFYIRGLAYQLLSVLEKAIQDYQEAIRLEPTIGSCRAALMGALRKLGRNNEADEQERLARPLMSKATKYDQACFESICGNKEKALDLLKIALESGYAPKEWARQDPDFENLRTDPRFQELVSE